MPLPLNYLNLEYKRVAWAGALADLNLVAIYYGEAWAAAQNGGVPPPSPEATSNLDGGAHLQRIFRGVRWILFSSFNFLFLFYLLFSVAFNINFGLRYVISIICCHYLRWRFAVNK